MKLKPRWIRPKPGRTLIVGSKLYEGREDDRQKFPLAVGVDIEPGPGVDIVHDMERLLPREIGLFDHVVCISVLEHCKRPWRVARTIEACMVSGGTLYLRAPTVWRYHAYSDDYWRFLKNSLLVLFPNIDWKLRAYEDETGEIKRNDMIPRFEDGHYGRVELHGFGYRR